MDGIMELKGKLQSIYANGSKYIDKLVRFALALLTFVTIGRQIGYMHTLTNPAITLGLSVICAFLPPVFTVLAAAAVILGHVYSVSLGMMIVTAVVFLLMFIFYVRLAPGRAVLVLVTALACMLKIPSAAVVGAALLYTPSCAAPVALGMIAYGVIVRVKASAAAVQSAETGSFITDMTGFAPKVLASKEMWLMVIAAVICVMAVYGIRRSAMAHAWKVASAAGAGLYLVIMAAGGGVLGVKTSFGSLLIGAVAAVITGLVLELFFFCVDYTKCESLQYEDDEYYYYVKAVPKIGVAAQEKTVKKISGRESRPASEVIDAGELRKKTKKPEHRTDPAGKKPVSENTDHLLLTRSLKKELNLDDGEK